ncbi:hypothetical protein TD95_003254, partial [Thielaviopsis punctulata]
MLWGDEIEYLVVVYSEDKPAVLVSLRQAEILDQLSTLKSVKLQDASGAVKEHTMPVFHPEFGRFMLETTPGKPWGSGIKDLLEVEPDMRLRRKLARAHMLPTEYPITLTTFPRLGSPGVFSDPYYPPSGDKLRSQFVPDEIANPHIRFPTLAANIRSRRGRKVQVNVPVFFDENTPKPWVDPTVNFNMHTWPEDADVRNGAAPDNFIHMDAMAFGMGSCCLQITIQAKNLLEARTMYDQLSPIGPIMLALTAATPIYKGFLANTDVRWNQIGNAVDDRTPEELGEKPLESLGGRRIPKSRYASNSTYISTDPHLRPEYFDPDLVIDPEIKQQLMDGGMDERLATHFAHLFIRDPIVIFEEDLQELDLSKTDHFENIQSTNWQHIRFKPPPANSSIGWRVEFRPMEIQLTDFENAAFSVFIVLVARAIMSFGLNFYIPIRKIDENMERAHALDSLSTQRFYFRKNPFPVHGGSGSNGINGFSNGTSNGVSNGHGTLDGSGYSNGSSNSHTPLGPVEDEYTEMTINEVINGQSQAGGFPGLIPIVETYLDKIKVDIDTRRELDKYLGLIRQRANGELCTTARWIRDFVARHPAYQKDSVVSEQINRDLIAAVIALGDREANGERFNGGGVHGLEKLYGGLKGGKLGEDFAVVASHVQTNGVTS